MHISIAAFVLTTGLQRLRPFDLTLIAVYLLGITLFGLRFRKRSGGASADRSLKSYFLANNTIPWWAIALSVVSAETSTLTIISIPGVAFAGDFGFLQIVLGYMLGRIVVAALFLPRYFAGEMLTAYQLIDRRFGPVLHKVTAGIFLLTRAAAEGVRVFAVSIVVGIAIGTRDVLSIAIISGLTLLYTFEGGMAAVIWTDVVQMAIYVGGTIIAVLTLGSHVAGGWPQIHAAAAAAGKFHMFDFTLNLSRNYTFWAGVLGGTFLTMASHGTDQLMVQRLLAARNLRESRLALLSSGVVIFFQFALFLLIGVGLYVFYGQHAGMLFRSNDYIFPTFIVREMPVGIAGLLIAAILAAAMSNLSAALNSLSSTTVVDFYIRLRPQADERERGLVSKSSTVLWAVVLFTIAVYSIRMGGKGHVVEIGLSIASVAYGCLLGVFLLGTLTRYASEWGATTGMICGFALNLWLWQGTFPVHLGPLTVPHIAFTWYVVIGAVVTFLIGSLASLVFRKQPRRTAITAASLLFFLLSFPKGICVSYAQALKTAHTQPSVILSGALASLASAQSKDLPARPVLQAAKTISTSPFDFTPVNTLINDAIAAHKLPGAVVVVGHGGKVVFQHAYGVRKLANEPGLDGIPSPAESMTEDTVFDMASLTKCLATATAVMQLYEQGKITSFDDPLEKYLPEFNPQHDPARTAVTLRLLLTHYSGEPADVDLKDPWGLAAPDRAEGFRRALTSPLQSAPGAIFRYSDVNFILLGALIEKLSGQSEDVYVQQHIFVPLGLAHTRYLPFAKACGPVSRHGAAITLQLPPPPAGWGASCHDNEWLGPEWILPTAPTAHDNEGNAATNPDFDHLLRGAVHDPTTRRMGGVAGHAGVFSTAHDMGLFCQALLDRLAGRPSSFPLQQSTLALMTTPEQPGHSPADLSGLSSDHYPSRANHHVRAFGWDVDSDFSRPRGTVFPVGSFGHTGFTGTSLWMDPASNTYVILLANSIHPRGNPPISTLRGEVATAAARALGLAKIAYQPKNCNGKPDGPPITVAQAAAIELYCRTSGATDCPGVLICAGELPQFEMKKSYSASLISTNEPTTITGVEALETSNFSALTTIAKFHSNHFNIGLLTNQNGLDPQGNRTIDILHKHYLTTNNQQLTTLFSPEHGIFGKEDSEKVSSGTDPATGLHVTSLYGPHDSDKRPSHEQLKDLDAVVIDLQDAGVHFWTYESVLGYFLEASAQERETFHHRLDIVVLDRPNPIDGIDVQGPMVDADHTSYVAYMPLPVRHGLTYGELARYINGQKHLNVPLTVVAMQHWKRSRYFEDTGLTWVDPSPNLRSPAANILYPALGLIETTNISVGRGTEAPFSFFGAGVPPGNKKTGDQLRAWFHAKEVVAYLAARRIPGVTFATAAMPIAEDSNQYPFHGQTIEAVQVIVTDRAVLNSPELGIEILSALHHLYPTQFHLEDAMTLVANQATMEALRRGDDPHVIAASWSASLDRFRPARTQYLLY